MPLSINTNIASMTAQRSFLNSNQALETSFERLSTGKRVNSAVDDAAGLAIGKDLDSRVRGLNQAVRNVNDGISMVQIMEGAYDEVTTILQRMRDLAVQAATGSMTSTERDFLDAEHAKLATAIDSVMNQAKFANKDLVAANTNTTAVIHSGAEASDTITVTLSTSNDTDDASGMGIDASTITLNGNSAVANATSAIGHIDDALNQVATQRAALGASQSQLEAVVRNLANVAENTSAAAGRVMDTDYASETANLTKAQILQQAATSILAQANAQPQAVLSLLQ
jgi:flagellin